jgi:hypothetical protein
MHDNPDDNASLSGMSLNIKSEEVSADRWLEVARELAKRLASFYWVSDVRTWYRADAAEDVLDWEWGTDDVKDETTLEPRPPLAILRTRSTTESDADHLVRLVSDSGRAESSSTTVVGPSRPRRSRCVSTPQPGCFPPFPPGKATRSRQLQTLQTSDERAAVAPASLRERSRTTSLVMVSSDAARSGELSRVSSSATLASSLDNYFIDCRSSSTSPSSSPSSSTSSVRKAWGVGGSMLNSALGTARSKVATMVGRDQPTARRSLEALLVRDSEARGWDDDEDESGSEIDDDEDDDEDDDVLGDLLEPTAPSPPDSPSSSRTAAPPPAEGLPPRLVCTPPSPPIARTRTHSPLRASSSSSSTSSALSCRLRRKRALLSSDVRRLPLADAGTDSASVMSAVPISYKIDPLLAAVEDASRFSVKCVCAVCGRRGANYPTCAECEQTFCSRACRTGMGDEMRKRRHVCGKSRAGGVIEICGNGGGPSGGGGPG